MKVQERAQCCTGRTSLQKAIGCCLHFWHSLSKCCHNRQAIIDNNVSNLCIKNFLRMYWHGQTAAAFSLQLFTLGCASEAVTFKKKLCSLSGSKQWQRLNFSRPSLLLLQLSSRHLNLKGPLFNRCIYLCIHIKWKYRPLWWRNTVLDACQQSQKKSDFKIPVL